MTPDEKTRAAMVEAACIAYVEAEPELQVWPDDFPPSSQQMVLVPREITLEMAQAFEEGCEEGEYMPELWNRMIAVAQEKPE